MANLSKGLCVQKLDILELSCSCVQNTAAKRAKRTNTITSGSYD